MEQEKPKLIPKLLPFATCVVLGHFAVVIWHLLLLVKVQPNTPGIALLLLVVINLIPVTALVVFAKGHNRLAGALIVVPFGVALVIGSYTHFLTAGTDNVVPDAAQRTEIAISSQCRPAGSPGNSRLLDRLADVYPR